MLRWGLWTRQECEESHRVSLHWRWRFLERCGQVGLLSSACHRPQPTPSCSSNRASNKSNWQLLSSSLPSEQAVSPGAASYNLKHFITGQFGFPAHFKWHCWGSATLSSPHWSILTVTFTASPCYSVRPGPAVNYHTAWSLYPKKCCNSKVRANCENHFCHAFQDPNQRGKRTQSPSIWGLFV